MKYYKFAITLPHSSCTTFPALSALSALPALDYLRYSLQESHWLLKVQPMSSPLYLVTILLSHTRVVFEEKGDFRGSDIV